MPSSEGLQKHTLNLYEGDYEKLQALFPDVGAGPILRRILRAYIEKCEAGAIINPNPDVEVDI